MVFGDLIKMNNMYQFSLASFIKLFKRALEIRPQAANTQQKLEILSDSLIKLCYSEIGRSLFKADRLTYSIHFIKGVYPKLFQPNEWEFFNGSAVTSSESQIRLPRWAQPDRKEIFGMYCNTFGQILNELMLENESYWLPFGESPQPELNFPDHTERRLSSFQKLLLIQVLRPDRLESAMQLFLKESFGNKNVQPSPFSLPHLYESESTCNDPILFIISPGSDPSAELQEFAE
jgi:dynein heavy chain 2, cytosolic